MMKGAFTARLKPCPFTKPLLRDDAENFSKSVRFDTSQLNRLGDAQHWGCDHYNTVGAQLSVLLLSHPGSDDIQTTLLFQSRFELRYDESRTLPTEN